MSWVIEILCQEHRNIEKLLRVLEQELNVFNRGERPNYELVVAVIDYFKGYPDTCHHPKEDMIFERLKLRDANAAATIGDLGAEHQEGARRLYGVAQIVEAVLNDQDFMRQIAYDTMHDFIDHERRHMAMEERLVFPAALKALRPADWAEIALKLADRHDPLSHPNVEEKFDTLRRSIFELEGEAGRLRHPAAPN